MQIKLARGTMWLLGTPRGEKDDVISLNFNNPGPIEVDYDSLSRAEKKQIILSLKKGVISSPEASTQEEIQELVGSYMEEHGEAERPPARIEALPADPRVVAAKNLQKDIDRATYLSGQTVSVIRSALTGEKNIRILNFLIDQEKENKNRKSVITAVRNKIEQVEQQIAKVLAAEEEKPPMEMGSLPGETKIGDVVESEEDAIVLSPDQIRELANIGF